jgi:membrane fusion protein (multidrug efflux system)
MSTLDHLAGAVHLTAMMRHLVIAVVALAGCKKPGTDTAAKGPATPPIKVKTVIAEEAMAPEVVTLTGMIVADQRSEVTADTQGKVIAVMIERGKRVKFGQPVVQLDVQTATMSKREALANLSAARAQKELADQECARTKALLEKGAITQSEYDRQMTQCRAAQDQVAATQARTDMMEKSVADGLVRAPFDGVVAEKNVSPGEWVQPGKPLFTLVKDDPLKIELSVPEKVIPFIKIGAHVDVSIAHADDSDDTGDDGDGEAGGAQAGSGGAKGAAPPGHAATDSAAKGSSSAGSGANAGTSMPSYSAVISRKGAEIGRTRALIVEAQIDNGSGLVPGMFAEAHVVVDKHMHVVLPETAVDRRGKQKHVFVVTKEGEAEDDIVQLGAPPAPGQVTVLQGVKKGQKVIANVSKQIVDGTKVTE